MTNSVAARDTDPDIVVAATKLVRELSRRVCAQFFVILN
jgi:hypothetical protein